MADRSISEPSGQNRSAAADELKHDAEDLKETARRQGEAKADQEKQRVGRAATSASSAMQTAADELREDSDAPDWLASGFSGVAREVDSLAHRLQNKSPRELAGETRRFARENPTAFLAASAAAGFAAARFFRAGAEYDDDYDVGRDDDLDAGNRDHPERSTGSAAVSFAGERSQTVAQDRARTSPPTTGGIG
ncbi:hypothetical protein [Erythrobacter sp. SD-21]|uniref:hypothetical protein n=1 Tax=Erythrobacter sp. SD-21 TaxID=161528 RepID=UPI000680CABF|nr:hypothetical protein [Erythrobacter sp. SD-21]